MGIENETQRTSSKLDCKHNVLHKPILLKMEKEIINLNPNRKLSLCSQTNYILLVHFLFVIFTFIFIEMRFEKDLAEEETVAQEQTELFILIQHQISLEIVRHLL